jgi:hypothetical protein
MIAMMGDGALAVSGWFDRWVQFGVAAADVAEPLQTFVAVVAPRD